MSYLKKLHSACRKSEEEKVVDLLRIYDHKNVHKLITEYEPDSDAGPSALHISISVKSEKIIEDLVENGASYKDTSRDGRTCLHWLLDGPINGRQMAFREILKNIISECPEQINVACELHLGFTPLMWGVKYCSTAVVNIYLETLQDNKLINKLNFFAKTKENQNVFHLAACIEDGKVMKTLAQRLTHNGKNQIILDLLQSKDIEGHTPVEFASKYGCWQNVIDLSRYFTKVPKIYDDELEVVIQKRAVDLVQVNESLRKLINLKHNESVTLVHILTEKNYSEALTVLVEGNIDKKLNVFDRQCPKYKIHSTPIGESITLEMCTALHIAAVLLHHEIVVGLIKAGASTTITDRDGYTPEELLKSYRERLNSQDQSNADRIITLLQENDLEKSDIIESNTKLHTAVMNEDVTEVRKCITEGFDVNDRGTDGKTPLVLAVESENYTIFQLLISMGASTTGILHVIAYYGQARLLHYINDNDDLGNRHFKLSKHFQVIGFDEKPVGRCPPIHIAIYKNYPDVAKQLIQMGASVNKNDDSNTSAKDLLDYLVRQKQTKYKRLIHVLKMAEYIQKGWFDIIDETGQTKLHHAAINNDILQIKKCRTEWDLVDIADNEGKTALVYAVEKGHSKVFKLLLSMGASRVGILHYIAYYGRINMLDNVKDKLNFINDLYQLADNYKLKLHSGSSTNPKCPPLHVAILQENVDVAHRLVILGASLQVLNDNGQSALNLRGELSNQLSGKMIKILDPEYIHGNELHNAVINNDMNKVRKLLTQGYTVNETDDNGKTPLMLAVEKEHPKVLQVLMFMGAETSGLLHTIAYYGTIRMLGYVKTDNSSINGMHHLIDCFTVKKYGGKFPECTPLYVAVLQNHLEMVQALIERGALVSSGELTTNDLIDQLQEKDEEYYSNMITLLKNMRCVAGYSKLHVAVKSKSIDSVRKCLLQGHNLNKKDVVGKTVLMHSIEQGSVDILQVLIMMGADITGIVHFMAYFGRINLLDAINDITELDFNSNYQLGDCWPLGINEENPNSPPIHIAILRNHMPMVKKLIELGASMEVKDDKERAALDLIPILETMGSKTDIMTKYLKQIVINTKLLLHNAIINNDVETARRLILEGCDLEYCDNDGKSSLAIAVENERKDILNILLGVGTEEICIGIWHYLAYFDKPDLFPFVKELLDKNRKGLPSVDVYYKINDKLCPKVTVLDESFPECPALYVACMRGSFDSVQELMALKASTNLQIQGCNMIELITSQSDQIGNDHKHIFNKIIRQISCSDVELEVSVQNQIMEMNSISDKIQNIEEFLMKMSEGDEKRFKDVRGDIDEIKDLIEKKSALIMDSFRSVDDLICSELFICAAEAIGNKPGKWIEMLRHMLQNTTKEFQGHHITRIKSQSKSDHDSAMLCLFYWKAIFCNGVMEKQHIEKLGIIMEEIQMPDLSTRLGHMYEDYNNSWKKLDKDVPLDEQKLLQIADQIGANWKQIGITLLIPSTELDHIQKDNADEKYRIFQMLVSWYKKQGGHKAASWCKLSAALKECGYNNIVFEQEEEAGINDDSKVCIIL